jgi:hypothetical protein
MGAMTEPAYRDNEPTGWTGWIAFAGVMLMIVGTLNAINGLIAIINDDWVVFTNNDAVSIDITGWGWIHLVLGVVVFLAGLGVFTGNVLARTVGVIVACISVIANFLWLPVYPIWSTIIIAVDVLVIWALTAHGAEMATGRGR